MAMAEEYITMTDSFSTLLKTQQLKISAMKASLSIKIVLGISIAVTLFHFGILLKLIPYDIAWGGRLTNDNEMYVFESISLVVNFIFAFVLLIKGKFIKQVLPAKAVQLILWVFLVLFALNTVGNIFAETNFKKGFTFVTLALVVLLWVILKKNK